MLLSSRPIRKSPALSNAEIYKHSNYRERRRVYSQTQPPHGHVIIIRAYGIPTFFHTQPGILEDNVCFLHPFHCMWDMQMGHGD